MADQATGTGEEQEEAAVDNSKQEEGMGGNSLQDASNEAVRFMEEGDEPGHAGRGDGG